MNLVSLVKGDLKASFPLTTTTRCRESHKFFL